MINQSLSRIAINPELRNSFIKHMLNFEKEIFEPGVDIREEIIGPVIDGLFDDNQIVRKELSDGTVFDFLYRSKIARDFVLSEPNRPDHVWEPQTTRLLLHLSKGAKNVVVGGAYFGDQSILMAKNILDIGGVVHAFEPNNDQRNMLIHNAKLNHLTNLIPRNEGLWDNSSTSLKLVGYDSFARPELADSKNDESFETITIDDYLKASHVDHLDLIMLDIEGAEYRALTGASSYLRQDKASAPKIVFEVHQHYVDWSNGLENTELIKFLMSIGYQVFAVRDFNSNVDMARQPIELIPVSDVYLEGPPHGFNMVAAKDISLLTGPNFRFCHHVSPKLLRHKDPALHHPIGGL